MLQKVIVVLEQQGFVAVVRRIHSRGGAVVFGQTQHA